MPIFGSEHPETSITVKINQFTQHHDDDDFLELRLTDLIELIKVQPNTGATEAARALRKKIKYGTLNQQLLALKVLELLVINSGLKIGGIIANDDKLNQVLVGVVNGNGLAADGQKYPPKVVQRTRALALGWHEEFRDLPNFKHMAELYKHNPKSRRRENKQEVEDDDVFDDEGLVGGLRGLGSSDDVRLTPKSKPPPRPTTKSPFQNERTSRSPFLKKKDKKDKKKKKSRTIYADEQYAIPQINYKVEAPKIRSLIADCYTQLNNLDNSLTLLPGDTSPLDEPLLVKQFDKCKLVRHKVLKYLQFVGVGNDDNKSAETIALDMEFLGSLLMANEKLVEVFKKFDSKCGYNDVNKAPEYNNDVDSDESYYTSDDEEEEEEKPVNDISDANDRLQSITLASPPTLAKSPPPRPVKPPALSKPLVKATTNDSDPFGDGNEVDNYSSKYI